MAGRKKAAPGEIVYYTPGGKAVTHGGSGNAYSNYGCRCLECRDANTARYERRREERRAMTARDEIPASVKHGSDSTYTNWGCKCEPCSTAHARKCAEYYNQVKLLKQTEGAD